MAIKHEDAKRSRIQITPGVGCTVTLDLVRGGKRAYLWVGDRNEHPVGFVSGVKTLLALARAILAEVPQ